MHARGLGANDTEGHSRLPPLDLGNETQIEGDGHSIDWQTSPDSAHRISVRCHGRDGGGAAILQGLWSPCLASRLERFPPLKCVQLSGTTNGAPPS